MYIKVHSVTGVSNTLAKTATCHIPLYICIAIEHIHTLPWWSRGWFSWSSGWLGWSWGFRGSGGSGWGGRRLGRSHSGLIWGKRRGTCTHFIDKNSFHMWYHSCTCSMYACITSQDIPLAQKLVIYSQEIYPQIFSHEIYTCSKRPVLTNFTIDYHDSYLLAVAWLVWPALVAVVEV